MLALYKLTRNSLMVERFGEAVAERGNYTLVPPPPAPSNSEPPRRRQFFGSAASPASASSDDALANEVLDSIRFKPTLETVVEDDGVDGEDDEGGEDQGVEEVEDEFQLVKWRQG